MLNTTRKVPIRSTRAKMLEPKQFQLLLDRVRQSEHGLRDEAMLRLSFNAGLRAQEIAGLQWTRHILTATGAIGDVLRITQDIAKGRRNRIVERDIPIAPELRDVLRRLHQERPNDSFIIYPIGYDDDEGCTPNALVQYFKRLYAKYGYIGCTSHSGRVSFITTTARVAPLHGASIKDVQQLAGHRSLETTAGYIEPSPHQRKLIGKVY